MLRKKVSFELSFGEMADLSAVLLAHHQRGFDSLNAFAEKLKKETDKVMAVWNIQPITPN